MGLVQFTQFAEQGSHEDVLALKKYAEADDEIGRVEQLVVQLPKGVRKYPLMHEMQLFCVMHCTQGGIHGRQLELVGSG